MKTRLTQTIAFILFGVIAQLSLLTPPAHATTMQNNDYIVDFNKDALFTNPTPMTRAKRQKIIVLPSAIPVKNTPSLVFTTSVDIIDFGILSGTNPVSRSSTLTLKTSNATGAVFAQLDHDLIDIQNNTIPQTRCDNGMCDTNTAAAWINALTFGYGYHCTDETGLGCDAGFFNDSFFKQFPLSSAKENPILLMQSTDNQQTKRILTYKLTIPASQNPGYYSNTLTYIGVSSY